MAASSNVFIDNLTISNGLIANFGPGNALGAAIFNNGGTLTLTTCAFNSTRFRVKTAATAFRVNRMEIQARTRTAGRPTAAVP